MRNFNIVNLINPSLFFNSFHDPFYYFSLILSQVEIHGKFVGSRVINNLCHKPSRRKLCHTLPYKMTKNLRATGPEL